MVSEWLIRSLYPSVGGTCSQSSGRSSISKENVALIKAIHDAFGVGDAPGVLGRMSADIDWREAENSPYADRKPYVGPQAAAEGVFGRVLADWEDFQVAPV